VYSPNGIQTILFDLDGTLRYNRPASFDVFLDYAAHLGANNTPEVRRHVTSWTHYYWAQSPELAQDVKTYRELNDDFWVHYATRCLVQSGESLACAKEMAPEINRYMLEEHHPEDWIPPEVPETLELLKEAGFHLGVLSNRDEPCTAYLGQVDLLKYFELGFYVPESVKEEHFYKSPTFDV
jgi:FMN phosphatase YigB (HAD superfamily)